MPLLVIWKLGEKKPFLTQKVLPGLIILFALIFQFPYFFLKAELWPINKYGETFGNAFIQNIKASEKINKLLKPEESFYEWGMESGLYFYSKRSPVTRVVLKNHYGNSALGISLMEQNLKMLQKNPPELFIEVNHPYWHEKEPNPILIWIKENYAPFPKELNPEMFLFSYLKGGNLEKRLLVSQK